MWHSKKQNKGASIAIFVHTSVYGKVMFFCQTEVLLIQEIVIHVIIPTILTRKTNFDFLVSLPVQLVPPERGILLKDCICSLPVNKGQ